MKWLSKKNGNDEISYWQTIADILSALFLIILLISLLLILYILHIPEDTEKYSDSGDIQIGTDYPVGDLDSENSGYKWREYDDDRASYGGDGGDDSTAINRDYGHEYEYDDEGWGDYPGNEKAAVYVRLLDAETGKIIREKDISFSLFNNKKQELLTVYYPEKITYKEYSTTEQGTFYLPDKIRLGEHRIIEQSEPYGYDSAGEIVFTIEESHEWDEPFILDVPLYPQRNVLRILQMDSGNGTALRGGLYRITADEDIITADGTLRHHAGDVIEEITCDENGIGISQELYLGRYRIEQISPPENYSLSQDTAEVIVEKKQEGITPAGCSYACEQTVLFLILSDELYQNERIPGVSFILQKEGEAQSCTYLTDENGSISIGGLAPNSNYRLKQESASLHYSRSMDEVTFMVDENGFIDGNPAKTIQVYNRMIRATFLIRDSVLRTPISDCSVSLLDADEKCVAQWTSSGNPYELNGLAPGEYTLLVPEANKEIAVLITDTAAIQANDFSMMTNGSILTLALCCMAFVGGILFITIRSVRKRTGKHN